MFGRFVLRHRLTVLLSLGMLALAGAIAASRLPSGVYPEVDFPRIVVVARSAELPADLMTTTLTRPLEEALITVLGVQNVRSRTLRGASEISLTFADGTDMELALNHVDTQIARVRSQLPAATEIEVERLSPTAFPVVTFNLAGPLDARELYELAQYVVRPALAQVQGVGQVRVIGGELREVEVILDPLAAAAAHLTPHDVAARIRAQTSFGPAGRLEEDARRIPLLVSGEARAVSDLRDIPLAISQSGLQSGSMGANGNASVPLGSIATVVDGASDPTSRVGGPGENTVIVSVSRVANGSTRDIVRFVEAAARDIAHTFPAGVTLVPVYDQADLVEESLGSVREAILIGIGLCLLILWFALKDFRAGVIAAAIVPLTLAITFLGMRAFGASLNLMSLGGMAVAVGLVIDDAIIVIEAIVRRMEEGESAERATEMGLGEVGPALIGTTLTTVVVFIPLAFTGGIVGAFFAALALPLSLAVLISLAVCLTGLPVAAARFLRVRPHLAATKLELLYRRLSNAGAERRYLGPLLLVISLGIGVVCALRMESGFLPQMDEGAFVLDYFMPPGTSLEQTTRVAQRLEGMLRAVPEVLVYSRRTGAELGPAAATSENRGDIMVRLRDRSHRRRSSEQIMEAMRVQIARDFPELRIEFVRVLEDVLNDLAGAPHPIEVKVFGEDTEVLADIAADIAEKLTPIEGVVDLYDGVEGDVQTRVFRVNRAAAVRANVSAQELLSQVSGALLGVSAGSIRVQDRLVNVRVRYPDEVRWNEHAVEEMPVLLGGALGGQVAAPLRTVASFESERVPLQVTREDLRGVVVVSAATEGRDLGSVVADVRRALRDVAIPPGYRMVMAGQAAAQASSFSELTVVVGFGLLLVLLLLVAQFRRLKPAFTVMLTTPFAIAFALLGLYLTGTPLDASSWMGLVLLVGLEVKAGILLLEVAEEECAKGLPYVAALQIACQRRIRPIMMTATATMAGVLPLALEQGAGAEIQRPLAIAVLAGIGLSKFVVLVALPSLAVGIENTSWFFGKRSPRASHEPDA